MNFLLGILGKSGIPIWLFKVLPLILVLGYTGYKYYEIYTLNDSLIEKNNTLNDSLTKRQHEIAGLLIENSGLRDELTIFVKKAEDTTKSVEKLTSEINTLQQQAVEKLNAIKQYQASDAKRCVLSAEWLRVYKQITTSTDPSASDAAGGSTKPQ